MLLLLLLLLLSITVNPLISKNKVTAPHSIAWVILFCFVVLMKRLFGSDFSLAEKPQTVREFPYALTRSPRRQRLTSPSHPRQHREAGIDKRLWTKGLV